jgi:hypothetical protein
VLGVLSLDGGGVYPGGGGRGHSAAAREIHGG